MLVTLQVEHTDLEKLQAMALKTKKPVEEIFHTIIEKFGNSTTLEEEEEELAFNESLCSPKVVKAISSLNRTLQNIDL